MIIPDDKVVRFIPEGHCEPCHLVYYDGYGTASPGWFRDRYRIQKGLVDRLKECEDK